jgi:hypothetical protein
MKEMKITEMEKKITYQIEQRIKINTDLLIANTPFTRYMVTHPTEFSSVSSSVSKSSPSRYSRGISLSDQMIAFCFWFSFFFFLFLLFLSFSFFFCSSFCVERYLKLELPLPNPYFND